MAETTPAITENQGLTSPATAASSPANTACTPGPNPSPCLDSDKKGGLDSARSAGASPLLHLLHTTAPVEPKDPTHHADHKLLGKRSAIARKADTLRQNLQDLIDRNGIDCIGFVTLTFKENICSREVAEKRFHSFATHVLPQLINESITVPERQQRGAIHYHLAAAFKFDIRTGFDIATCREASQVQKHGYLGSGQWRPGYKERFKALERQYLASANANLRHVWRVIARTNERIAVLNRKPGRQKLVPSFGRCQTLPILTNADAIAFYVGTYITSATEHRAPEDRGMRTVRYSLVQRRVHQSFHFFGGGNRKWRTGCKILAKLLLLTNEVGWERDGKELVFKYPPNHPYSRFGPRWAYRLASWVRTCEENETVCMNFAASLPPEMTWRRRLMTVGLFIGRLMRIDQMRRMKGMKGGRHAR